MKSSGNGVSLITAVIKHQKKQTSHPQMGNHGRDERLTSMAHEMQRHDSTIHWPQEVPDLGLEAAADVAALEEEEQEEEEEEEVVVAAVFVEEDIGRGGDDDGAAEFAFVDAVQKPEEVTGTSMANNTHNNIIAPLSERERERERKRRELAHTYTLLGGFPVQDFLRVALVEIFLQFQPRDDGIQV
jgi:hypothetical protein